MTCSLIFDLYPGYLCARALYLPPVDPYVIGSITWNDGMLDPRIAGLGDHIYQATGYRHIPPLDNICILSHSIPTHTKSPTHKRTFKTTQCLPLKSPPPPAWARTLVPLATKTFWTR